MNLDDLAKIRKTLLLFIDCNPDPTPWRIGDALLARLMVQERR